MPRTVLAGRAGATAAPRPSDLDELRRSIRARPLLAALERLKIGFGHDPRVSIRRAAEAALRERLVSLGAELDGDGRAEHLRQVVVDTVDEASLGQAAADVREGSGGELTSTEAHRPKFHSAFSSCALAVNVFGPWRLDPASLVLGDGSGFTSLQFEAQRRIFNSRATPPNLDVVIEAADRVVAIESKLTEYLGGNEHAAFADRYREVVDEVAHPTWREVFRLLEATPEHFRFLNADQLVKHYLGLKRAQQRDPRPVTLSYLYWEPLNPEADRAFTHHRSEAAEFAGRVADPEVALMALSYPELWDLWDASGDSWVGEHVARLRERYAVQVGVS
jgi:hypothetical protein